MEILQELVKNFCTRNQLETTIESRFLDFISESGEFAKEILKASDYGKKSSFNANPKISDELGDVFFSLICLANSLNISLEQVLKKAIEKYENRILINKKPSSI